MTMTLSSLWRVHAHIQTKKRTLWEEEGTKKQEQMKEKETRSCVDVLVLVLVHILVLVLALLVADRFPEEGLGRNAVAVSVAVLSSLDK